MAATDSFQELPPRTPRSRRGSTQTSPDGTPMPRTPLERRSAMDYSEELDGLVLEEPTENILDIRMRRGSNASNMANSINVAMNVNRAKFKWLGMRTKRKSAWHDLDEFAKMHMEGGNLSRMSLDERMGLLNTSRDSRVKRSSKPTENMFEGNLSEIINKEIFEDMHQAWNQKEGISRSRFGALIKRRTGHLISDEKIGAFFAKLDVQTDEELQWEQLAGYMHLVLGEQDAAAARARSIDLVLPARGEPSPHLAPIARVRGNARKIMSMDEQAVLTLWPPTVKEREPYAPTRTMHMEFDKDFKEEGERDTGTITWATDFCMLPDMGKMVISSGERKMYFYDSYGDFALQFVVTHFDAVPTRLCSHFSQDLNATVLFWGDSNGALGALVFPKYFAQSQHFRMHILKGQQPVRIKLDDLWPEPRKLLEYGGVHMRQWHGHSEWVNEIKWIESIGSFVSVSGDCQSSMIVGEVIDLVTQPPDSLKGQSLLNRGDQSIKGRRVNARQLAFSVTKGGIRSVDFSSSLGLLATGGTDRQIRCWSPHMTKHPESVLRGHDASVTALQFKNNKDGHGHHKELMSLDSSQTIKVWDVKAQICILTVSPQMHGITEETTDIYFGERTKALLLFPKSKAGILKIKEGRAGGQGLSHLKPVRCGLFNARFNQMVTACDKGIIKSWCIRTGAPVFEFRGDEGTGAGINSMTLDHTSTKLITAFDSGATTRWQFSTGQKLNAFQESAKSASPEVTRVLFQIAGQMRSVITVGWSRKVTIYRDQPASEHTLDIFPENDHWNSAGRHTDDITAACLFGANTLATGAYNGDVILWNLSTGRPRTLPTRAAMETGLSNPVALQEYIVLALASIPSRVDQRDAAQLIVSTTTGIQFWNTKLGLHGALMGQFKAGPEPGVEAKAITLTDDCRHLIVGDSLGRIAVYDISTYCHKKIAAGAPPLLKQWRAHLNHPVMSLTTVQKDVEEEDSESESGSDDDDDQIAVPVASIPRPGAELTVESPEPAEEVDEADAKAAAKRAAEAAKAKVARAKARAAHRASKAAEPQKFQNFVVSTSSDCRARMWAISGRFLGTFNGEDSWKWEDKSTWQEHDTPVEIRQADEAKKLEDEQDSRLDHMEATGATHSRPKPALAWGLEAAGIPFADPAEAALEDASKIKSPTWDISNPPGDLIEALTGKSNVAMMKYIGAGGGSSGQGFYARRTLQRPKLTGRSQSAPAGLRSRAVVDKPPARRSCRVPVNRGAVIAPGLPRKLGNYERSIRATAKRENEQRVAPAKTRVTKVEAERPEKALYNDAKDRMAATSPELQALAHLEVHEKPLLGHDESYLQEEAPARMTSYNNGTLKPRQRAVSAAAPGRRRSTSMSIEVQNAKAETFNRYRDSIDELPKTLRDANDAAMRPQPTEGFSQFTAGARAKHGVMRAQRGSMQVEPMVSGRP